MMRRTFMALVAMILFSTYLPSQQSISYAASPQDVVINEIAWMGTTTSYNNEWMELYNNTDASVNLDGWTLNAADGTPSINLSGSIPAHGYYLLERTSDDTIPEVTADLIYTGALGNTSENLALRDSAGSLIDQVNGWYAGDNTSKATMERINPAVSGNDSTNWETATSTYSGGYGTPKTTTTSNGCSSTAEQLNHVSNAPGAINVYFNKCAYESFATNGNKANYNVNLENRLLNRINSATTSIDMATYEINLPKVIDALMNKAAQGVDVRILADAKDATDPNYIERYQTMRLYLEELVRGKDGQVGTADDVHILSDSIIFAVEDPTLRSSHGLPSTLTDLPYVTVNVGSSTQSGYRIADGEVKSTNSYYSPDDQMHNKFVIIDGTWVFTGSWNFTVTGLYGSDANMDAGILGGNTQNEVEINSTELADIYKTEFDEMWGTTGLTPDPVASNFHSRKTDNTVHSLTIGGHPIEVYFSAGDDALGHMTSYVKNNADYSTYFNIFAWSDQALVDELKNKWEGSYADQVGTLTGFKVKGVFDGDFWNQWWSASIEMTGRTATQTSTDNPNTRWNNPAPVYSDNEDRKLHSKTMLVDVDHPESDPTVIIGSTNWSTNGNDVNDENMLFIHDANVANQFLQEFYARYDSAGGALPTN